MDYINIAKRNRWFTFKEALSIIEKGFNGSSFKLSNATIKRIIESDVKASNCINLSDELVKGENPHSFRKVSPYGGTGDFIVLSHLDFELNIKDNMELMEFLEEEIAFEKRGKRRYLMTGDYLYSLKLEVERKYDKSRNILGIPLDSIPEIRDKIVTEGVGAIENYLERFISNVNNRLSLLVRLRQLEQYRFESFLNFLVFYSKLNNNIIECFDNVCNMTPDKLEDLSGLLGSEEFEYDKKNIFLLWTKVLSILMDVEIDLSFENYKEIIIQDFIKLSCTHSIEELADIMARRLISYEKYKLNQFQIIDNRTKMLKYWCEHYRGNFLQYLKNELENNLVAKNKLLILEDFFEIL
ncbi:TPA: hypothetical protein TXT63_000337 [Streptococcus suis]|nr:hypothetical protein [Streptococcus suis]